MSILERGYHVEVLLSISVDWRGMVIETIYGRWTETQK